MVDVLRGLLLIIPLLIVPLVLGVGFNLIINKEGQPPTLTFPTGFVMMFFLLEIAALPCIFLKASFDAFFVVYWVLILLAFCGVVFFIRKKKYKPAFKEEFGKDFFKNPYVYIGILLILFQVIMTFVLFHYDEDDALFIGTSVTSLEENSLFRVNPETGAMYKSLPLRYVFSGFLLFYGFLSKTSGIEPVIIAHKIVPALFILACYLVWWNVGGMLFKDRKKQSIFIMLIALITIFSNTSGAPAGAFMLHRIWQGKALLANLVIPMLLLLMMKIFEEPSDFKKYIGILITVVTGICVSSMGVALCAVCVFSGAVYLAIRFKKLKIFVYSCLTLIPCLFVGIMYVVLR